MIPNCVILGRATIALVVGDRSGYIQLSPSLSMSCRGRASDAVIRHHNGYRQHIENVHLIEPDSSEFSFSLLKQPGLLFHGRLKYQILGSNPRKHVYLRSTSPPNRSSVNNQEYSSAKLPVIRAALRWISPRHQRFLVQLLTMLTYIMVYKFPTRSETTPTG